MADTLDVVNKIADDVAAVVVPLVGTIYNIGAAIDAQTYGAARTVPATTIRAEKPQQQELTARLAANKASISVEADIHDGPSPQFTNEGSQQDLIARTPLTIAASADAYGVWTLSGTASVGNLIGVQYGASGASYVIAETDTLATIATALSAACAGVSIPCTITGSGSSLLLPTDAVINCGTTATYLKAVSRRRRNFDVMLWCPNPFDRDFLVRALEPMYRAGVKIAMVDGSELVVVEFLGTVQQDPSADAGVRDGLFLARLRWLMDFTVTQVVIKTQIVAATLVLDDGPPPDPTAPLLASQL